MNHGISDIQINQLLKIFSSFPEIEKVILYGSRAKGEYQTGSDVDIVLYGEKLTKSDLNKIDIAIDDLLLPWFFDISIYHQISNNDMLDHIERVGIVIYQRTQD